MSDDPGFDPMKNFSHVAFLGGSPHVLVVNAKLGITTFAEFVDLAKRQTKGLEYPSASAGSPGNLVGELLSKKLDLHLVHVAYRGAGEAINDLVGGHVKAGIISYSTAKQFIDSGNIVAVAVSSDQRLPDMAGVPSLVQTEHGPIRVELRLVRSLTTPPSGLNGPLVFPIRSLRAFARCRASRASDCPSRTDGISGSRSCRGRPGLGPTNG
jgi:tripartite-type tricarboxylate transporter receptor subunit TctC